MHKILSFVSVPALVLAASTPLAHAAPRCAGPPATPYGHILGKIETSDTSGEARIAFSNPKGLRVDRSKDVYLVTCDGALRAGGRGKVRSVDDATSTLRASFGERGFSATEAVGQYVLIDAGNTSAAPAGVAEVPITNVDIVDGAFRIMIGAGEEDGVRPESTGFLEKTGGDRVYFTVLTATRRASTLRLRSDQFDRDTRYRVVVNLRQARCYGPDPVSKPAEVRGVAPKGYVFADMVKEVSAPTFTVATTARSPRGGVAYVLDNGGAPLATAIVEASGRREMTLRLASGSSPTPDALRRARVLLPKVTNERCED